MDSLRALIQARRLSVALLLVATLLVKAVVPAGFMISSQNLVLTVAICDDGMGKHLMHQTSIPMKELGGEDHDRAKEDCPFTALAIGALGGVDPVLLLLAVAFILALGFAPLHFNDLRQTPRLRPPLRGPPLAG